MDQSSSSSSSSVSPFWPLLEATSTITIVPEKRTLIAFLAIQPIQQVITALSQHHILSAPVVSATEHTILGSVDVLQIADYLSLNGPGEEKQPIIKVIEHARNTDHEPMTPFYSTNPLSLLVDLYATGVHRVALFTESCELVTPVSQSDVIAWLSKNLNKTDAITAYVYQSIDKLFGARNVKPVSVSQDTSVRDTIKSMRSAGVSSVAIIDDSGCLVGAFAPSDLRGLVDINTLSQPVINYLKAHAQAPIIVKADTTLSQIITTLATKRQHRVWVVDDRHHPVSIISTTDIMRVIGSGAPVTARQANADIDASKLWIAKPFTLQVTMNMISDDIDSSTIQVSASTQTKIGWSKMT